MKTFASKIIFSIIVLSIALFSCKKALESIVFTKEYNDLIFVVDTTSLVGDFVLGEQYINTDILARLQESEFNKNNVKNAELKSIRLECLTENQDFNFIAKISARMSGEFDNSLIIAEKTLPEFHTLRTIDLDVQNFNLNEFFKHDQFIIRLVALTDLPIEVETTIKVSARFEIKAGI